MTVLAVAFVSCNSKAVFSPNLQTAAQLIRVSAEGVRDTITFNDSLQVGDTVYLGMLCNGFYDYLKKVSATGDESKVLTSLEWPDSLSYVLADDSDQEHGCLSFLPEKVYAIYTTLTYIPVASGTHKLDFQITSAAPESYNLYSGSLVIAVK